MPRRRARRTERLLGRAPEPFSTERDDIRVRFGAGSLEELGAELDALGVSRALWLSTPGREPMVRELATRLGTRSAGVFAGAVEHVPVEVVDAAAREAERCRPDAAISVGGGSTIGLGKALALRRPLTLIAIPTTYSGSEMTSIYGLSEGGRKRTGHDPRAQASLVIYDPPLTSTLPTTVAATGIFNAIAHCVEALYSPRVDPIATLAAEEGVRVLGAALKELCADPLSSAARASALYGAYLAGACVSHAKMGLQHKLAHVLGGTFRLAHGPAHTVLLPQVVAYNAGAAPDAMRRVGRALGCDDVAATLHDLALRSGAPTALSALGLRREDLAEVARLALEDPYPNPRPLDAEAVRMLLADAWEGARPSTLFAGGSSAGRAPAASGPAKLRESVASALEGIGDGARIMVGGFGLCGNPEALIRGVLETGARDLTVISNNSGNLGKGLASWLRAGIVAKVVCTYIGNNQDLHDLMAKGAIEVEVVPQGTFAERIRAAGAGLGGFYTPTGVGTLIAEGKEERVFLGRPFLLEEPLRADFALIRARRGDPFGNLRFWRTARNFSVVMATAARITIAEVDEVVALGALDPDDVHLPGLFVQRVLEVREHEDPFEQRTFRPRASGGDTR